MIKSPAKNPCGSCPYRRDVPSGLWVEDEYAKLPLYDGETWEQPGGVFMCHQADGRLCAGWVGCHDMDHNMAVRLNAGEIEDLDAVFDYETSTPLFGSGAEAAAHGRADIDAPGQRARRAIIKLERKKGTA